MLGVSLKERCYHTIARNLFLNQQFTKVVDACGAEDIALIPLKGIALIQRIYPDWGQRHIGDIDLLVRAKDLPRAAALLERLGYQSRFSHFNPRRPYSPQLNSLIFTKPAKIDCVLHLHWHLLNSSLPLFLYKIDIEDIWRAARPQGPGPRQFLMLEAHQQIVYLCVHAVNHGFNKLSLFEDLAKAIEFYRQRLDWRRVQQIAIKWKAQLPVYYSLFLTAKIIKLELTRETLNLFKPKKVTRMGRRLLNSISADKLGSLRLIGPLYFDMTSGLARKINFAIRAVLLPPGQLRSIKPVNSRPDMLLSYFLRLLRGLVNFFKRQPLNSGPGSRLSWHGPGRV